MTTKRYFAAFNGGDGFCSSFGEIFSPQRLKTIYIIKGGPGTGKSTFMKKIKGEAERRGIFSYVYLCSSDTNSLDGIIIPEISAAIVDGTAPHVTEAKYPGACERILDFTSALDVASLCGKKTMIEELSAISAENYSGAYAHLFAAKTEKLYEISLCEKAYMREKARAFAKRLVSRMSVGEYREVITSTFCKDGYVRLTTNIDASKTVYSVGDDCFGYLMLSDILAEAKESGADVAVSRDPIAPSLISEIYFEKDGICICSERGGTIICDIDKKAINMRRFESADAAGKARSEIRRAKRATEKICDMAKISFEKAASAHAELERIYSESTDFYAIDAMLEKVTKELFEK